jgi:hypothetical protein
MSDTPETDALVSVGLENSDRECVPAEFGRKLERERDEARQQLRINKMNDTPETGGCEMKIEITKGVETPVTKFFSTTPETDVAEYYIQGEGNYVRSDISRKFERERNEAIAERDILRLEAQREAEHHDRMVGELEKVYVERDECYQKITDLESELRGVGLLRDEAMEQLIHLRSCVYDVIHSLKTGAFYELEKAWKEGLK